MHECLVEGSEAADVVEVVKAVEVMEVMEVVVVVEPSNTNLHVPRMFPMHGACYVWCPCQASALAAVGGECP